MTVRADKYYRLEIERDTYKVLYENLSKVLDKQHERMLKMRNCSNCKYCKDLCEDFDEEKYVCDEWEFAE